MFFLISKMTQVIYNSQAKKRIIDPIRKAAIHGDPIHTAEGIQLKI